MLTGRGNITALFSYVSRETLSEGDNMKFKIIKASDCEFVEHRTFTTIEEIQDFVVNENKNISHVLYIGTIWNC